MIDQADLRLTVTRLFKFSVLAGTLAGLAVSTITPAPSIIACAALAAAALPLLHVLWKRKQRLDKFLAELPEALDLMSRALSAGHAFSEALNMVTHEMADPIAMEFRRTYDEQNLGLSSKVALENLVQRIPLLDLRICVTAIHIQRETGGNLAEILEKVAGVIRERFRILASQTGQAHLLCPIRGVASDLPSRSCFFERCRSPQACSSSGALRPRMVIAAL
ncbi:MAG: type II secretion system F family protein [Blastocatellia bacterium]